MKELKATVRQILIDALIFQIKKALLNHDYEYAVNITIETCRILKNGDVKK